MTTATLQRAREALDPRKLKLPARPLVESISVEEMVDWEGDEGLRVLAVIGEDTRDDELTAEFGHTLKFAIRDALEARGITEFPYLYIARPSDLVEESEEDEPDDAGDDQ